MVELRLPGDQALLLEEDAGLYEAVLLAFLGGHCHSLALALRERTGWPLVAIDRVRDGQRVHVAVRRDDGCLVDITGAHTAEQMSAAVEGGVRFTEVSEADCRALVEQHGWAEPTPATAEPWVDVALEQCELEALEPMTTPNFTATASLEGGIEVSLFCDGSPWLRVDVRRDGPWLHYADVRFPADGDGICRMPFHESWFATLAESYLSRDFDPARVQRKLEQDERTETRGPS